MSENAANAIAGGSSAVASIVSIFIYILLIAAEWRIFSKAGEAGWASLIPIYNMYVLFRIIYGKGIKFLLLLVPLLNIIVSIAMWIRLAEAFGKGIGFGIGMIFFPNIFTLILAFGSAQYVGYTDSFI